MSGMSREAVAAAVERKERGEYVPVFMGNWWGVGLREKYGAALDGLSVRYPDDLLALWYRKPGNEKSTLDNPEYRYGYKEYKNVERHSIGKVAVLLDDWSELDAFLAHFPDPEEPGNFDGILPLAAEGRAQGRYMLGCWWGLFHEFFWSIRGMENLMMDYYDNMEGLKAIGRKAVEYYKVLIRRYAELGCAGIFTSDDLGHQRGPMMSPAVFRELYLPLYREVIHCAHSFGLHFFLHSCGDNTLLLDMLIEAGLDVLHPIQKGCMDLEKTVREYGDRLSFLVGVDVQDLLVNASEEEVREEVRSIRALFAERRGGLLLAMGNGIMPDSPLENIRAALEEMHRQGF